MTRRVAAVQDLPAVVAACGSVTGALAAPVSALGVSIVGVITLVWCVKARQRLVALGAAAFLAGAMSAVAAHGRIAGTLEAPLPEGPVRIVGTIVSAPARVVIAPDHLLGPSGWEPWRGPRVQVAGLEAADVGDRFVLSGDLRRRPRVQLGGPVAGDLRVLDGWRLAPSANPVVVAANALRSRVESGLRPVVHRPEGALVSGFLIGDVRRLPPDDYEALRLAGLSHFVVVSGSNVALFLAALWLATGPLGWSPHRRIVVGLVGVVVFAVVTRWEPSVLRASAMAVAVLGARLVGWHVSALRALSLAVTTLVVATGSIVYDVGFQLSVAATAGIVLGASLWVGRRPLWLWASLGASLSAQVAVAPILLGHFGSIPIVSPLTNLVSAPLVAVATMTGGVGAVAGAWPLVEIAAAVAGVVLVVARAGAEVGQIGWVGFLLSLAVLGVAWRHRGLRGPVALISVVAVGLSLVPAGPPDRPVVRFLDVGQGDATLFQGPGGETILLDGGLDPRILRSHLRQRGVRRIDLLVITHRHADHSAGLVGITRTVPVARVWHPPQLGESSPLDVVVDEVVGSGALAEVPSVGDRVGVGEFEITVLGPLRRYASPNDGSIVLLVEARGHRVLMTGDIEAIAQAELGPISADVMKVPHQGAATSSLEWLKASRPAVAVISVGPNTFGHPSQDVIGVLEGAGAVVRRTDLEGTITILLDRSPALASVP
ncbi:MAG: ComEC/Rec2 family competence protein [Acidimicrobiia bacterium]